jgi:hypothetical protein
MGGMGRGGSRKRASPQDPAARLAQQLDDNDTRAFLEAESVLTEAQIPPAEAIATSYREQLSEAREARAAQSP